MSFISVLTSISVGLTLLIGIGGLVYAAMFVWAHVFELLLTLFSVKKEFIAWVREKNQPKVFTPKLSEEQKERIKAYPTRKKEDD